MEQAAYYHSKREDLERAVSGFIQIAETDLSQKTDFEQDVYHNAAVQKFEYSIELFWKAAKLYLDIIHGVEESSPKSVIKAFYRLSELDQSNYEQLIKMVNHRNLLSHIYKLEKFDEICRELTTHAQTFREVLPLLPKTLKE